MSIRRSPSAGCSFLFRIFEILLISRNRVLQHRTVLQFVVTTKLHCELNFDGPCGILDYGK